MSSSLFFSAFGTVFLTEMLGDKALLTISALATRFRGAPLFTGIMLGFMAKMFAAVIVGRALAGLPSNFIAVASSATFLVTALVIWFKKNDLEMPAQPTALRFCPRVMWIAFAAIFFSEWADAGQLCAALLAARHQAPMVIWLAATLALATKGTIALVLGLGLRRYLPREVVRIGAFAVCLTMSVLSMLRV